MSCRGGLISISWTERNGKASCMGFDVQEKNTPPREVRPCLVLQPEEDRTVNESLNDESPTKSQFVIGSKHETRERT